MMILRSAAPSPFGRKVQIALAILGFNDVRIEPVDTMDPGDRIRGQNPLGKIPVLIAADGTAYYDSRVILEYLDHLAGGGKVIPPARGALCRVAPPGALRRHSRCVDPDVYEGRWRPARNTKPNGSITRPQGEPRARRAGSRPAALGGGLLMSATSRSPARSAIVISASAATGAPAIRGWSRGSTVLRCVCRRLPPLP